MVSNWQQYEKERVSFVTHCGNLSPGYLDHCGVSAGSRWRVHISVKHQTGVTNRMWIETTLSSLQSGLSLNLSCLLVPVCPSRQMQACLAWVCFGPVLPWCAQMVKDQKGIKEKKTSDSVTEWRNTITLLQGQLKDMPCVLSRPGTGKGFVLPSEMVWESKKLPNISGNSGMEKEDSKKKCVSCLCRCPCICYMWQNSSFGGTLWRITTLDLQRDLFLSCGIINAWQDSVRGFHSSEISF